MATAPDLRQHQSETVFALSTEDNMSKSIPDILSDEMRLQVKGTVEADGYAYHRLWVENSVEFAEMFPDPVAHPELERKYRHRKCWVQCNPGTMVSLGDGFTSLSLSIFQIDGEYILFWYACSSKCDFAAANEWVRATFPNATEHVDAQNFGNAIPRQSIGKWSSEMPLREGKYWTRTHDGEDAGILTVSFHQTLGFYCPEHPKREGDSYKGEITSGTTWGGLWWTVPLPEIPAYEAPKSE